MRTTFLNVAALLLLASPALANNIFIPNGDFNTITQPSPNTSVTATSIDGWTNGVGSTTISCCGNPAVNWSDSTTGAQGDPVVVPGWQNTSGSGGIQTVAGSFGVWINGAGYGAGGGSITSTSSIGTIQPGLAYTLSIQAGGVNGGNPTSPVSLDLLSPSNTPVTPSSTNFPTLTGSYQTFSQTYSAAALAAFVGDPIVIQFGAGSSGNQTNFDNVTLTATPEPSSLMLCGLGAVGLLLAARRRRKA